MNYNRPEHDGKHIIFNLLDDSMAPQCKAGDQIQVDTTADIKDGDTVVAFTDYDTAIMRKLSLKDGEYVFTAANPQYPPIICKNPTIIGKVVRVYRNLLIDEEEAAAAAKEKETLTLTRQQRRVVEYIISNGGITTLQAYNELGITSLPKRISELSKLGLEIFKRRIRVKNRFGEEISVIKYSLIPPAEGEE